MAEHSTLQELLRFGRDGQGAIVFSHTSAIPDWVPIAGEGRVVSTRSEGIQEILEAAQNIDEWTTAELAEQVSIGERQVRQHLQQLHADGFLDREMEGRGYVWRDTGLHEVNEHGEVELESLPQDKLDDEEVAELARSTVNTWEFRNITPENIYSVSLGVTSEEADQFLVTSD
jgi:MarR-like DNA-binding transcriptional regulator SgrR of sgrS sRNA